MKNIYEVLRQKESDLQQLQKEVEALRLAARLLADESGESLKAMRGAVPISAASGNGAEVEAPVTPFRQFP